MEKITLVWEGPYRTYGEIYRKWDESMKGIYVMTDGKMVPLYIGKTYNKYGFGDRYNGHSFIDAAMKGASKMLFFARIPNRKRGEAIERELIWSERSNPSLTNSRAKDKEPPTHIQIQHEGSPRPKFLKT
jgi:hypothetical protein